MKQFSACQGCFHHRPSTRHYETACCTCQKKTPASTPWLGTGLPAQVRRPDLLTFVQCQPPWLASSTADSKSTDLERGRAPALHKQALQRPGPDLHLRPLPGRPSPRSCPIPASRARAPWPLSARLRWRGPVSGLPCTPFGPAPAATGARWRRPPQPLALPAERAPGRRSPARRSPAEPPPRPAPGAHQPGPPWEGAGHGRGYANRQHLGSSSSGGITQYFMLLFNRN